MTKPAGRSHISMRGVNGRTGWMFNIHSINAQRREDALIEKEERARFEFWLHNTPAGKAAWEAEIAREERQARVEAVAAIEKQRQADEAEAAKRAAEAAKRERAEYERTRPRLPPGAVRAGFLPRGTRSKAVIVSSPSDPRSRRHERALPIAFGPAIFVDHGWQQIAHAGDGSGRWSPLNDGRGIDRR